MTTTGEKIEQLEFQRAVALRRADGLLWEVARNLAPIADASEEEQRRHLGGLAFREFVKTMVDARGKPRTTGWARELVRWWRAINRYPGYAEAVADRVPLSKAFYWCVTAEREGWEAEIRKGADLIGEMGRSIARGRVADRLIRECLGSTWAETRRRYAMTSSQRETVRMGGPVLRETKLRWMEAVMKCAALNGRQVPSEPAFEWQVETVLFPVEELIEAAEKIAVDQDRDRA